MPSVAGAITTDQAHQTGGSIASTQLPSGAIPWFDLGHTDPWDHVQAAMALSASGFTREAERAYEWSAAQQRADGSWAIRYQDDIVEDPNTDSNFCAYLATGVWHHWLVTGDRAFARRMWPTVARGIEVVLSMQRADGAVAWARSHSGLEPDAHITGNASIHLSLRCAVALAELVGESRPDWELAAGRLRHALDDHPESFSHKSTHSMDWYYPLLGGAMDATRAASRIDERWGDFIVDGLGARCVSTNPWVTGAETCELVLALDTLGRSEEARRQITAMQHLRHDDGSYWTGLVYEDNTRWPIERTTWTAATVILAADALSRSTGAHGLFRGEGLPTPDWKASDSCPCRATL